MIAAIMITGIELWSILAIIAMECDREPFSSDRSDRSNRQLSQNVFQTPQYCGAHGLNVKNLTVYTISLVR